jgi:hypothetical protein
MSSRHASQNISTFPDMVRAETLQTRFGKMCLYVIRDEIKRILPRKKVYLEGGVSCSVGNYHDKICCLG